LPGVDINVWEDDFSKMHSPAWWQKLFCRAGLVEVVSCQELEEADILYEDLLIKGLIKQAPELRHVEITHVLTFAEAPYVAPEYADSFRHNALFIGSSVRQAVQQGRADFTPVFLSEIPGLFRSGILPLDVALISLSPPDEHGFCSLGSRLVPPNRRLKQRG
jgi:acyl-CoA hydrolase